MTMCHSIELIRYQIQVHNHRGSVIKSVSAFFDILTGYFLLDLSSSSSKEYALRTALKIATGEILQISEIPDTFGFTTSKECSSQFSQKSAEF